MVVLFSKYLGSGGASASLYSTDTFENLSAASADGWVHFVGAYKAGEFLRLYVDGVLIAEQTTSVPTELQSKIAVAPFKIGAMTTTSTSYYLNGAVDDVQVYDHAVTNASVSTLFSNPGAALSDEATQFEGLVAYWDFNEGTGTTATDSENALVGTLSGSASWTEGVEGGAIQIVNDDDSQLVVETSNLLDIIGAVSVSAWVHPDGMSNYGVIAGIDQSGGAANDQYVLKTTGATTSYLSFQVTGAGTSAVSVSDTQSIVDRAAGVEGGWIHVAGVFIPGEALVLYVDGVEIARKVTAMETMQSVMSEAVPFRIGNMTESSDYGFNGAIDEVGVYNIGLSPAAIADLADRGGATAPEGTYVFSFGAVADPQYKDAATAGSRYYRNSLIKLPVMVSDFNARDLEFVICLGDFIDNDFASFEPMMEIWDDLVHPSYQVVGNHDLSIGSHTLADVIEVLNIPSNYYTFEVEGWRFFVLDGNDAGYGIHSSEQLAWLRDGLDSALADSQPVIIFDHYPVYPPGTAHISPQASELLALLADYPNVRAWMNGHNHSGAYGESGDIHFINLEGMVETADTTAYAEIEIWTDRIEVKGEGREPNRTLYFPEMADLDLEVPAALSATDGGAGVSISWTAVTDSEVQRLELQRRASGQNDGYTTIANVSVADSSYLDTDVESGMTYSYRIRSLTVTDGFSGWSDLTSLMLGYLSDAIGDFSVTADDANTVTLIWDLDGVSYDTLIIERRVGAGDYTVVTSSLSGTVTTYQDSGLAPNTRYEYRVSGVIGGRQTEWSSVATATTESAEPVDGEAAGLVAYWPFDEGSGTTAGDFSGNGLSGTLQAAAAWESAGHRNGAIRFSGDSNDQVVVGTPEALNITGAVSVSAWVKPAGSSRYGVIAGIDNSGGSANDQYVLKTTHSDTHLLSFQVTAGGVGYAATDSVNLLTRSSEGDEGWVHVAGIFVPGEAVLLYVNGHLVATTPVTIETLQSALSSQRPFRIGNMTESSDYGFNGSIDELRVFAASLSAEDVSSYANDEIIVGEQGLLVERGAEWSYLDDGSDQGTAWTAIDFDDSAWPSGATELGYGDGDEATEISYGSDLENKHPTTYLRKAFNLDSTTGIEGILIELLRDDGVILYLNGQELLRDNMPMGTVDYQSYASSAISGEDERKFFEFTVPSGALVVGSNVFSIELHNSDAGSSDLSFNMQAIAIYESDNAPTISESVIEAGSEWTYLDDGSNAGTAWSAIAFDDSTWSRGHAKFGYGDSNETTSLSYGPDSGDKHITYYFRSNFEVEDLDGLRALEFGVLRDDGVIVYLNGIEIIRDNMPVGTITSETFSSSIVDGSAENIFNAFTVGIEALQLGRNVLAVEIHNRDGTSSDLGFDFTLNFISDLDPNAPVFDSETLETAHAEAGTAYSASVAEFASDADGDEMFFTKVSGPEWLIVNSDGSLSGIPSGSDFGLNRFVISVTDNDEGTTTVVLEVMVEEPAELARAPMPGTEAALHFAVIPDTQGSTLGVPTDEASAIARELIAQAPDFAIHVGDVTDGNSSDGNVKLTELEYLKEVLATPLLENGIGFYPVRGNHDANAYRPTSSGEAAWQAAFPYLFEGEGAVVDPTDVPGGSELSPNYNNFCYVLDAGHDTYFVSLDLWNGGTSDNYSDWVAEKFAEIREANPDAHIFGYSHPGLFAMASHWWSKADWYDAGTSQVVSDIVSINGMRETPGRNRCDAYTLKLSYDTSALSALEIESLRIAAFLDFDTSDNDAGDWIFAHQATLGTVTSAPLLRAPTAEDMVGTWGIDVDNQQVWARLDYQGDFAVLTDVIDSDRDGLVDAWEMEQFGTLAYTAAQDLDEDGLDNAAEQLHGTDALLADSDGDLFSDGVEIAEGLSPLSADIALSDSVLDFIRTHSEVQAETGLYPLSALGGLNYQQALIGPNEAGELHFQIQLLSSETLGSEDWSELGDVVERTIPIDSGKNFFKWEIKTAQP